MRCGSEAHRGSLAADISRELVRLYKEGTGKGPTKARTHLSGDLVVCVLQGGFLKSDQTLVRAGRENLVTDHRGALQDALRDRFISTIEELTGRRVISFMSGVDVQTETDAEIFVLESAEPDKGDERDAVLA